MTYSRINRITGWAVFAIAAVVYLSTMEATVSFWDCGEFIASCFGVQIPHPPGAPLFVLLGRLFIILSGSNPQTAAIAVNAMSALASAFTILFLFWTITHFARKMSDNIPAVMAAGVVGALAYTFSDSFWYSAVEGEVYALSSLFTAVVFWAVLKWEEQAANARADKWLVLIFFLIGLSIGVHLLNLLVIPAIVMVYYFKRYKPTAMGTVMAFIVGCALTGFVQVVMIQTTIKAAGKMDIWFVNDLGLPFFSGFAFFFLGIAASLVFTIRYAKRRGYYQLSLVCWSMAFLLLGYSTYLTTMIRSNADPAVDMFNVDNPVSLAGYLGREQYNDWPILFGPDFTEEAPRIANGENYSKGDKAYLPAGTVYKYDWKNAPGAHLFPRIWDAANDRNQKAVYQRFAGVDDQTTPTMADNIRYFTNYQAGWMYFRYFMWNFAGRQNDLQGLGNAADSNWVSGIPVVDNARLGDQEKLPDSIHDNNKAYNRLFFLPLVLGIAGLIWQYRRSRRDWLVNGLLFFFTGLAIVIYLNQSGYQPRERDYAYVGSFYAFTIWIGLGVLAALKGAERLSAKPVLRYATLLACLAVPAWMAVQEWDDHDRHDKTLARDLARNYLESCPPNALLISAEDNDTYMLWYLQNVEGVRRDVRVVVNTIFASDWYTDQLRYKIYDSAPFDLLFTKEQFRGNKRDVAYFLDLPGFDKNTYHDLDQILTNVAGSDDPQYSRQTEQGQVINLMPVRKLSVPVDEQVVRANGTVHQQDKVLPSLAIDIAPDKQYLLKNELALLGIIARNHWNRPICFTNTSDVEALGLGRYMRQEGMTWQLVPVEAPGVDLDKSYQLVMKSFAYGGIDKAGTYLDEDNRRRLQLLQLAHARIATGLVNAGRINEARAVLQHFDQQVKTTSFTYGMASSRGNQHNGLSLEFLRACYAAGDKPLAEKVAASLGKDLNQQMIYYQSLSADVVPEEQLAEQAWLLIQGKPGYLSDRQLDFAMDIVTTFQVKHQLEALRTL
ncbi:glycosyltransferase family 117 protein [Flavihumibacter petaseus]|uniref:DUF2723 domain-containing protein n=1 Tax=Flavihumibacter petaseus NBRC 106054 TaxID=1220578 RepID=A0A0E9N074_9BACT|nr:DUF2723 domain-containing protein [Flavihumibacter petaseus]GAO43392.1 hypothetical protein FPE01S_02_04970 [Flavihumibacter petaseus NBRC 106054]